MLSAEFLIGSRTTRHCVLDSSARRTVDTRKKTMKVKIPIKSSTYEYCISTKDSLCFVYKQLIY